MTRDMDALSIVRTGEPQEVRQFERGRLEVYRIGPTEIGRAIYEPGWRWSDHVGPVAGTDLCEVSHIGVVLSGSAAVRMADGREFVISAGDFFAIPAGHDSWVLGDERYVSLHLAGASVYAAVFPEPPGVAEGESGDQRIDSGMVRVAASYDRLALEYTRRIYEELAHKPFDRGLLDQFARLARTGRVCDVGCGPGHVARYLQERGCDVFGVDISPEMTERARSLNPGIEFEVADLRQLPVSDGSLAGIVAFYSLIHLEDSQLALALADLRRALQPGGHLLIAVHEGQGSRAPSEMWGIPVELRFNHFTYERVKHALMEAGLEVQQIIHRAPYREAEADTERLYALATNPSGRS
jgi:SAM-dependent methyltransferase/quercetin dioxygenase-like cupin family protein